jgi:uncharacterized delta-60 repeat protein
MKKIYFGFITFLFLITSAFGVEALPIDSSFGVNGVVTQNLNDTSRIDDIKALDDGSILSVGELGSDLLLIKSLHDGSLDTSFGVSGVVDINQSGVLIDFKLKLQSDGKILVGGTSLDSDGNRSIALFRFDSNGTLDSTFGTGGITYFKNQSNSFHSLEIDSNGAIYAIGTEDSNDTNETITVIKYNTAGNIDGQYGVSGVIQPDNSLQFGNNGYKITSAIYPSSGELLLAYNYNNEIKILKFLQDGSLDTYFGSNGGIVTSFGSYADIKNIKIQSDGKILLTGSLDSKSILARFNSDGSIDNSFGTNGYVIEDILIEGGSGENIFETNNIITLVSSNGYKFTASKYDSNGTQLKLNIGTIESISPTFNTFDLDSEGKILAAGGVYDYNVDGDSFIISRFGGNVAPKIYISPILSVYDSYSINSIKYIDGKVYTANPSSVETLDISDLSKPESIITSNYLPGGGFGLSASQDQTKIAVANGSNGVQILDSNLSVLYSLDADARDVVMYNNGSKLIVANADPASLEFYDINDTNATLTGSLNFNDIPNQIMLSNNSTKAFVACSTDGLQVVDITTPNIIGTLSTDSNATGVTLSSDETKAFIADGLGGLVVADVSTPSSPVSLGTIQTNGEAKKVKYLENEKVVAVANGTNGVAIVDVNDTSNLKIVDEIHPNGYVGALELSDDNKTLFVSAANEGLVLYDIESLKEQPRNLLSSDDSSYALDVVLSSDGKKAYVANQVSGFTILNVENPYNPTILKNIYFGNINDLAVDENKNLVYLADGMYGLREINISDVNNPVQTRDLNLTNNASGIKLSSDKTKAFVSSGVDLVKINLDNTQLDINDTYSSGYYINDFDITNDDKYVLLGTSDEVAILDLTQSTITSIPNIVSSNGVKFSNDGNFAFIADGYTNELIIEDVSDKSNPFKISSVVVSDKSLNGINLSSDETKAFISTYGGLVIVNISDKSHTFVEDVLNKNKTYQSSTLSNDGKLIYAVGNDATLDILSVLPMKDLEKNFGVYNLPLQVSDFNDDNLTLHVDLNTNSVLSVITPDINVTSYEYGIIKIPFNSIQDATGSVKVDINVSDGNLSSTKSFILNVYEDMSSSLDLNISLQDVNLSEHNITNIQIIGVDGNNESFYIPEIQDGYIHDGENNYTVPVFNPDNNFSVKVTFADGSDYWLNFSDMKLYDEQNSSLDFKTNINSSNHSFIIGFSSNNIVATLNTLNLTFNFSGDISGLDEKQLMLYMQNPNDMSYPIYVSNNQLELNSTNPTGVNFTKTFPKIMDNQVLYVVMHEQVGQNSGFFESRVYTYYDAKESIINNNVNIPLSTVTFQFDDVSKVSEVIVLNGDNEMVSALRPDMNTSEPFEYNATMQTGNYYKIMVLYKNEKQAIYNNGTWEEGYGSYTTDISSSPTINIPASISQNIVTQNTPPTISPIMPQLLDEDFGEKTININVYDLEDDNVSLSVDINDTSLATVSLSGKTLSINSKANAYGVGLISIHAYDGNLSSDYAFKIDVRSVDDEVVFPAIPTQNVAEDNSLQVTLNAIDVDGDAITYSAKSLDTSLATVSIENGKLIVHPLANANGELNIEVNATSNGKTQTQQVHLNINPVDDAPTIDAISNIEKDEDFADFNISLSAFDIENDSFHFEATTQDSDKVDLSVSGNTLHVKAKPNEYGTVDIDVKVVEDDNSSLYDTTSFVLSINPVDDAPTIEPIEKITKDVGFNDFNVTLHVNDVDGDEIELNVENKFEDMLSASLISPEHLSLTRTLHSTLTQGEYDGVDLILHVSSSDTLKEGVVPIKLIASAQGKTTTSYVQIELKDFISLNITPTKGEAPLHVELNATVGSEFNLSLDSNAITWYLGDEANTTLIGNDKSFTYTKVGNYSGKVKFVKNNGKVYEKIFNISVVDPDLSINLSSGWNFISFPTKGKLDSNGLKNIFSSPSINNIVKYNGSWQYWENNDIVKPEYNMPKFSTLSSKEGFFVNASDSLTLEFPFDYNNNDVDEIMNVKYYPNGWFMMGVNEDKTPDEIATLISNQGKNAYLFYVYRNDKWYFYTTDREYDLSIKASVLRIEDTIKAKEAFWVLVQ